MNNNFSPNMLKTFEECPKKYFFKYIKKISIPQKASFFEKGKKVHALAHYYLRGDDITKFEQALTAEEKSVWEALKSNQYFQKLYVNSEYNLSFKAGNFWIGGRLDALMKDKKDFYILDYKTGRIPSSPENDYQTMVYLLCTDKILHSYETLQFIYIDLKNNKNHIVNFDCSVKEKYLKAVTQMCENITCTKQFPQEYRCEETRCRFCEYAKICTVV